MLDQNFCEFLENEISKALSNSEDEQIKGFWCDGVSLPDSESEYSTKSVNDKRQVIMTAFAGQTGQDKYQLTLRFGKKALSRYSRELNVDVCLPNTEDRDWLDIDPTNKKMVVQLD